MGSEQDFAGVFPGMPRVESPAFEQEIEFYGLSDTERGIALDLHRNGYAIIDFQDVEKEARFERIKANLAPRYNIDFDDPEADKTKGERRIQDAWTFDEDVKAIAANASIMDLLSKLYGRQAFPFQTLNFPVGTQQDLHSDSIHFSSIPERFMCGVWVAMEDVGPEAGPVFYAAGSHRWPIVSNAMIGRRGYGEVLSSAQDPYGPAWNAYMTAYNAPTSTFLARKGQALIWSANLLHGGALQIDPRLTRWSQVTHYYFEGCTYYTPAFSDEVMGKLALRDIVGIDDGRRRPNSYLGQAWPEIEKPRKRHWTRRLMGRK